MPYSRKVLNSVLGVLRPTGPVLVTAYLAESQAISQVKQATLAQVGAVVRDLAIWWCQVHCHYREFLHCKPTVFVLLVMG